MNKNFGNGPPPTFGYGLDDVFVKTRDSSVAGPFPDGRWYI